MLDCGSEAWVQMVKFYGLERAEEILLNIKGIFISHLHADHHLVCPSFPALQFVMIIPITTCFSPAPGYSINTARAHACSGTKW